MYWEKIEAIRQGDPAVRATLEQSKAREEEQVAQGATLLYAILSEVLEKDPLINEFPHKELSEPFVVGPTTRFPKKVGGERIRYPSTTQLTIKWGPKLDLTEEDRALIRQYNPDLNPMTSYRRVPSDVVAFDYYQVGAVFSGQNLQFYGSEHSNLVFAISNFLTNQDPVLATLSELIPQATRHYEMYQKNV